MKSDYDVIIIGAGISGLSVGALLANGGKRVLIVEKNNWIGGRNFTIHYNGYELNNGGHAVIGGCENGYLGRVYKKIGKEFPEYKNYGSGSLVFENGKWKNIRDMYPRDEFKKITREIIAMPSVEIDRLDDISAKTWLMERTKNEGMHKLFWLLGSTFMGGNKYEAVSASECLYTIKDFLENKGKLSPAQICGGFSKLNEILVEGIRGKGGEICLNKKVSSIIVDGGSVQGVELEGEKVFPSHLVDTERIDAPVVVSSIPVPNLFDIVPEHSFPQWYVSWIKGLKGQIGHVWTLYAGMHEAPFKDTRGRHIFGMPGLEGLTVIAYVPSEIAPGFAPEGKYLFEAVIQGNFAELPRPFRSATNLLKTKQIFKHLEAGLEKLFPGFERSCDWKMRLVGVWLSGLIEPGFVGKYRPDIQPPEVEGLYLCGDSVRTRGIGVNAAAHSALLVAERILDQG